jgi:hypothetical protein
MGTWNVQALLADYATVVIAFLAIIVALSLWSSFSRQGRSGPTLRDVLRGPSVRDLFLTVRLARQDEEARAKASAVAHVRDIDLHGATIVSSTFLPRGERVRLDMPPVGAESSAGTTVEAEVASARRWRGAPDTWIVHVKFADSGRGVVKSLKPYLERLAGGSQRLSHA